jgi:hypothetical protein
MPLDPERLLTRLCRRHGVPASFGRRLRPLVQRAVDARPALRRRILDLVERSFVEEALREERRREEELQDERLLQSVARVLENWSAGDSELPHFSDEPE